MNQKDFTGTEAVAMMCACWCFALCKDSGMQCMLFWRYLNANSCVDSMEQIEQCSPGMLRATYVICAHPKRLSPCLKYCFIYNAKNSLNSNLGELTD